MGRSGAVPKQSLLVGSRVEPGTPAGKGPLVVSGRLGDEYGI